MRSKKLVFILLGIALPVAAAQVAIGYGIWRAFKKPGATTLTRRALPGFSVEIPDWKGMPDAPPDAWSDAIVLRGERDSMIRIEWTVLQGPLDEQEKLQSSLAEKALRSRGVQRIDKKVEKRQIAGNPGISSSYVVTGAELDIANWSCNDQRTLMLIVSGTTRDELGKMYRRMVDSIRCTPETAPKGSANVFPSVSMPASFVRNDDPDEPSTQRWLQSNPVEVVTVTAASHSDIDVFNSESAAREVITAAFLQGDPIKVTLDSEHKTTVDGPEGKRTVFYHFGTMDSKPMRLAFGGFTCPDRRTYIAMHYSSGSVPLGKALDRLLAVKCPTGTTSAAPLRP
jgi:hypothetical protein